MIQFEYKGKVYDTSDLEKKLRKMGITKEDIKIKYKDEGDGGESSSTTLYHFIHPETGYTVTSVYKELDPKMFDGYVRIN